MKTIKLNGFFVERHVGNNEWISVEIDRIQDGDFIRIFDKDGNVMRSGAFGASTNFWAVSDSYLDEDGCIKLDIS